AITASVIAAVYPAQLLQSTFVWTETLFALVFSAWVLACSWLNDQTKRWPAFAVALGGVAMYAIHPRGLGIALLALAIPLLVGWRARRPLSTLGATLLGIASVMLVRCANADVHSRLW